MANRKGGHRGGRKPAPVALKLAAGMRADRIPSNAPNAPEGPVEAPEWLAGYELEGWRRIAASVLTTAAGSVPDSLAPTLSSAAVKWPTRRAAIHFRAFIHHFHHDAPRRVVLWHKSPFDEPEASTSFGITHSRRQR
jgi:hypothetical protein